MTPSAISAAIREACLAELDALKPGNVHRYAEGHGMTVADFEASAEALAAAYEQGCASVGQTILSAVQKTNAAAGCNTNLGIVLLTAPLACAAQGDGDLRDALGTTLAQLNREDAELSYEAIRLAAPAGLGESERHDVASPPNCTLLEAMEEAKDRDRIARQYADGFVDVFEFGLPRLRNARSASWATTNLYLEFLGNFPDSHVERKFGREKAETLRDETRPLLARLRAAQDPGVLLDDLLAFDQALKTAGINPGTSADLTVATLFADRLLQQG